MTAFEHLERLCWNQSIWFGEWRTCPVERKLAMCRDITEMYCSFRRIPRENAEPWVWEAIEGLHTELVGLIEPTLPAEARKALMQWMHNQILQTSAENKEMQDQLDQLPF